MPTRILVTGGAGFLGSHVVERLRAVPGNVVFAPRSAEFDLLVPDDVDMLLELSRPHVVIHLAAKVGGIGAKRLHPGSFFRDNALMGIHLIEACRTHPGTRELRKLVQVGHLEALLEMLQGYRQEFGFPGVTLVLADLYGPRDHFDHLSGHVIPSMLRKFLDARERGEPSVTLQGDGTSSREFLYVEDAAAGIVAVTERYEGADPVNLGSGEEISMKELAETIRTRTGFPGDAVWDTSQPNDQPRRKLDTSHALERFGWKPTTPLADGLRKTLDWYLAERARS